MLRKSRIPSSRRTLSRPPTPTAPESEPRADPEPSVIPNPALIPEPTAADKADTKRDRPAAASPAPEARPLPRARCRAGSAGRCRARRSRRVRGTTRAVGRCLHRAHPRRCWRCREGGAAEDTGREPDRQRHGHDGVGRQQHGQRRRSTSSAPSSAIVFSVLTALEQWAAGPPSAPRAATCRSARRRCNSPTPSACPPTGTSGGHHAGQAPQQVIFLAHGFFGVGAMYSFTAARLAERTGSIVVVPHHHLESLCRRRPWINGAGMQSVVADLFAGNRAALTASALAAGTPSCTDWLPTRAAAHLRAGGSLGRWIPGHQGRRSPDRGRARRSGGRAAVRRRHHR